MYSALRGLRVRGPEPESAPIADAVPRDHRRASFLDVTLDAIRQSVRATGTARGRMGAPVAALRLAAGLGDLAPLTAPAGLQIHDLSVASVTTLHGSVRLWRVPAFVVARGDAASAPRGSRGRLAFARQLPVGRAIRPAGARAPACDPFPLRRWRPAQVLSRTAAGTPRGGHLSRLVSHLRPEPARRSASARP